MVHLRVLLMTEACMDMGRMLYYKILDLLVLFMVRYAELQHPPDSLLSFLIEKILEYKNLESKMVH